MENLDDLCDLDKENNIIILPEEVKMTKAINSYIKTSKFYVEYLHWDNSGILDGFIDHRKNMFLLNNEYDERKSLCDKLFNIYKTHDFVWSNQSFTSISSALFRQMCGYLPESTYNINTREMLDDFYPRALQWCSTKDIPDDVVSIDISKSYPNILLNNNSPIPIYSIHDIIEPFGCKNDLRLCGEFYLDETILENYGSPIKLEAGFYSSNLVFYLVDTLNMPTSQIKYKITTKKALKPDTFKNLIKYIFDEFPESEAKRLANSFIGELGRKYNKTNIGFTCTDYDTAMCCWTRGMADGRNVTIDHYNDVFWIKEQTCKRIFSDNTSINRFVVSEAILKLLQLIEACHGKDSVLYAYNTDGIFITNPKMTFKNKKDIKFNTTKIGKAYVTDTKLTHFEKHYRENMDQNNYKTETGKGCLFNGQAGSGKTTKLCQMVMEADNPLVLSFTNKAIENVKNRLIQKGFDKNDINNICYTFDSYFCEWNNKNISDLEHKTILIEEFSMVPNKWMTRIYEAFTLFHNMIYMFGDPNQCEPVEPGSQIHVNYLLSKTVEEMCPNRETIQYIEESARYDKKTHEMLHKFLKHGKISTYFEPINIEHYRNICYLNSIRIKVNTECCERFTENKRYTTVNFKYDNKKEKYRVCVGMPIIATQNIKDKKIFNTMEFEIEDMNGNLFKVNNEWFGTGEFSESFIPSFCVTVYKYQGCDINEHYNIHDVNRMDKKQLYTALSRTTNFEYIHINNIELNHKYFDRRTPVLELMNAKLNSLYSNGKIYKVTFNDGKVYIGSTCEELETRFKWHLSNNKSQVFKNRNENPKIELIINAPSNDKKSLEKVENGYIQEYSEKYGKQLLNEKCNPLKKVKKLEYNVVIENEIQLRERIAMLDKKLTIKDDTNNKNLFFDSMIDGKRYKTMARYSKKPKEEALKQINIKKKELIDKLTIYFN